MKFSYGISDFYLLRTENYFYVDRTSHISLIEKAGLQLLFLRPRRFGKSLLLSMLENYYDVAKADEFESLFGDLAIGQNPTPKHNQYLIMKWDFSVVEPQDDVIDMRKSLHDHLNNSIQEFAAHYQNLLQYQIKIDPQNAISSFESALIAIKQTPYRLYLLIDEYDNFANEVLMGRGEISPSRYKALLSTEGSLKAIFKTVKSASSGRGLERVFITGVSPVLMSDITSAYNVAENIYLRPVFNDLCGFRESEIRSVLTQIVEECELSPENGQDALTLMQEFYDGYCFSERINDFIFNPTLVLYFLKHFQQECEFPRMMLDDNLAIDRGKLSYISGLPNGEPIISQALNEAPPLNLKRLANRFGVDEMLNAAKGNTFIISLLYYLGILSFNGKTALGKLRFKIPNLVARQLYVEQLFELFLPRETERSEAQLLAEDFYQTGDLQALCDFMEQRYFRVFDNRDYSSANELTIKTAFLTVLFDDVFYIMDSELPLERRYADLTMIIRPEQRKYPIYDFFFEFKYLNLSDVGLSGEKAREKSIDELKALTPVKQKLAESKKQLLDYQSRLESKYGDSLRLQLISVVAVGFERVVWEIVSKS
ncbi:ATPase AAA [Candidatus Thiomargarita nelsonii]|uniref:ATPase AAA n=1 Tax=Candidatus Thiomargarita nelsonii TaxID=1003181 RepID=A0A4E0QK31_9GAMM|nr:ATPase AAA [Candidatus Thiomargarita nelsonii]